MVSGSVTVTAGGSFDGVLAIATFVGATAGIRETDGLRNGSGASTVALSTTSSVTLTDVLLLFGSNRAASTDSANVGASQRTANDGSAGSGCLFFQTPAAVGTTNATFSYGTAGTGNFQAIVAVKAV